MRFRRHQALCIPFQLFLNAICTVFVAESAKLCSKEVGTHPNGVWGSKWMDGRVVKAYVSGFLVYVSSGVGSNPTSFKMNQIHVLDGGVNKMVLTTYIFASLDLVTEIGCTPGVCRKSENQKTVGFRGMIYLRNYPPSPAARSAERVDLESGI